jgi:hypothetical protein
VGQLFQTGGLELLPGVASIPGQWLITILIMLRMRYTANKNSSSKNLMEEYISWKSEDKENTSGFWLLASGF